MKLHQRIHFSRRAARICFCIALICVLLATLLPIESPVRFLDDKAQHLLSFFLLASIGVAAWGRRHVLLLCFVLALTGGMIELLQATPLIGRDAEFLDWVADVVGIGIVLIAVLPLSVVAMGERRG